MLLLVLPFAVPLHAQQPSPWTVHDIYYGSGKPAGPPAPSKTDWSPDGKLFSYRAPDGSLSAISLETGKSAVLTPAAKLAAIAARPVNEKDRDHRARYAQKPYFWSPDGSAVLFDEDGTLWLDTLKTGEVRRIGDTGQGSGDDVQWSPDGRLLSYLHDGNLYALVPGGKPVALTADTDKNLRNGEVDWVYLEELKARSNYSWAPDSKHLAYIQMDETKVPAYPLTDWIPTHAVVDEQKYPQPGDANLSVRGGGVAAEGGPTRWIALPAAEVRPNQDYIPRAGWLDAQTVWVEILRRDHKHLDIWFADAASGEAHRALALTDAKFFDENYDLNFTLPGHLLLRSWRTGYTHLDHYTYAQTNHGAGGLKLAGQLEEGPYEVTDLETVVPGGPGGGTVYYTSKEGSPNGQQVWSVGLDGTGKRRLSEAPGTHKAAFAGGKPSFTDSHSDLRTPPSLDLCRVGAGAPVCTQLWKDNSAAGHAARAPELLTLKAADGSTSLYATLLMPEGASAPASVPLITNPYGGPGVATVGDSWGGQGLYFDQLLTEHGYAVLHVDNRGMGGRGRAFEQVAYRDFGKVQLADQLAALDQVLARYPQLDKDRLGWWGWSWGGTFTLNALTHSTRFRAGVSVAPVTDFRDYDSIYTERYLGLPAAEAGVYDASAALGSAARLHGRLLLIHGTGDDNVHIENTVQFTQKLIDNDLAYDLQLYPRKTHSIAGKEARTQLFERILDHWDRYLRPEKVSDGNAGE